MWKRSRSVAPAAVAAFVLSTVALGAQMPEPPAPPHHEPIPSITVNGSGEVRSAPDEAVVSLGVLAQTPQAGDAQREANRIARAILDAIAALGVPAEAVQTSQLTLSPVYEQPRYDQREPIPAEPRIVAYQASNVVTVRLDDLAKIGPVVDAGIEAGANQLQGVGFNLRNDQSAREEALRQAVAEARAKAAAIAAALGVELGPVLEAHEGGVTIFRPQPMARMAMEMAAADQSTPVAPGELTITGNVTVRYRIGG